MKLTLTQASNRAHRALVAAGYDDEIEISNEIHVRISELAQRNSPATGGG